MTIISCTISSGALFKPFHMLLFAFEINKSHATSHSLGEV